MAHLPLRSQHRSLPQRAAFRGLALFFIGLLVRDGAAQPLVVEQLTLTTAGGTARGYFAAVALQDPAVELVVTAAASPPAGGDAVLTTTTSFRSATGSRLAVNANYFSTISGTAADALGLVVSNGVLVSPVRTFNGAPDPAIVFDRYRLGTVGNIAAAAVGDARHALAGIGPSTTDAIAGTLLVTDGVNTGATARVEPLVRNPRTVIGVDRTGTTLYIFVIDGRQPGWSVGMTLPEVADFMIARGCYRAINLDGGGSSSFVYINDAGSTVQNRPSDGLFRGVSTNLGIRLNTGVNTPNRLTRPIRGAWLRPPTSLATLDTTVAQLAAAGITDLFLETLYWGQDTGTTGVFPARFGTASDYLAGAITTCARHGVRVHAWCETGYLDFGFNPSAILAANPGWVVKHRDPAVTTTGDQANQRFVNLGNPGVRTVLNDYFGELAGRYPGLEGIQADYHFFPLAGTGLAPWSFDIWARSAYQARYGVDPITEVGLTGSSPSARWLTWNRDNVTEALRQLRVAVRAEQSTMPMSAVAFADWSGTFHTSKMIDLPSWSRRTETDLFFVMSYFTGTNQTAIDNIANDIVRGQAAAPGRRVIAGLANFTSSPRPTVTQQLNAAKGKNVEDFAWFEANTFIANPTMLTMLRTWIDTSATPQRGDVNKDGFIDARDLAAMVALLATANPPGTPIAITVGNARFDVDASSSITAADMTRLTTEFRRYKFGEDGIVDGRDLARIIACYPSGNPFTAAPASPPLASVLLHLWDLTGDGVVNYDDLLIAHAALSNRSSIAPDADANADGAVNIEDVYTQYGPMPAAGNTTQRRPRDVNRDGVIDALDGAALGDLVRAGESLSMSR